MSIKTCEHCDNYLMKPQEHTPCIICHSVNCELCNIEYAQNVHHSITLNDNIIRLSPEHVSYIQVHYPRTKDRALFYCCIPCMTSIETDMLRNTPPEDLPLLVNVSWQYQNELYKSLLSKA